jgi:hypothetical protein
LNLPGPQVQQFYSEYWNLKKMYKLVTIYQELQDSVRYFLKLLRLGKKDGLTPEQIMKLVQMADSIHKLQDRLQQLQGEVLDISRRQTVGQEKLDLVRKTFNMKYEELKEAYSQAQKLQNYVEQFKDSQDYKELEAHSQKRGCKDFIR